MTSIDLTGDRTRQSQTDRLTGFGDRLKLIADLTEAVEPGSPPSVLAVFDIVGSSEYRRVFGERASDVLIARLATSFALVARPVGACYRPRADEFCVLAAGSLDRDGVRTMLTEAAYALLGEGEAFMISSWFGACVLPDEASEPTEALMLVDERLRTRTENRQPRERRRNARPS